MTWTGTAGPAAGEGRGRRGHLRLVRPDERPSSTRSRSGQVVNRRLVVLLLSSAGALGTIGLVMVLSASSVASYAAYGSSFLFAGRQALYALVGVATLFLVARIPYRAWRTIGFPFFVGCLVLLGVVLLPSIGRQAGGSTRWIELGPVNLQPSEFVKLALVAVVAGVLTRKRHRHEAPAELILPIVPLVGVVGILTMLQPDLGTTVVIAGTVMCMVFLAGVRLRALALAALAGLVLTGILILSEPYRRARFLAFLNPWGDPQNTGYHVIQSLIALGSGGLDGQGLGASRQKWLYVPNAHTEFIFSIYGEEFGLIGSLVLLALFGMLIFAGVAVARRAPDQYGRLLAGGITAWLALQTAINLGAVTGLLPVTGVTLPLVSFGGSSLIVTCAAIGVLIAVARAGTSPIRRAGG